ncbi:IS701 family transposase [Streptomyces cyaneofuscatus]|uniref:IS701 family transposase n=1 Tax=Streptomyces cyaneofuscatus TaxID=66883 RepID=UPI0033A77840
MNTSVIKERDTFVTAPFGERAHLPSGAALSDDVVRELCESLFSAFHRKDQRRRAEQYLRGLLTAQGRKSIRNIAAQVGGQAAEQSLHHFISSSTWDWRPMRRALAAHLERTASPQALVVRSMDIPKAGEHSVGVDRLFAPQLGHMFRGQQAFGVWFASEEVSAPVNWRLLLPHQWTSDPARRDRAEVPEAAPAESAEECAVAVALDSAQYGGGPRRPVLLDLRRGSPQEAMGRLFAAGAPVLARVSASARVSVANRALPGYGAGPLPAQRIVEMVTGMRRPVRWLDTAGQWAGRTSLATAVPVSFPVRPGVRPRPMLLLGEWQDPARPPAQLWLTDMTHLPTAQLLRTTKLTRRVDQDFARIGAPAGLRDFVGRSFRGWHRHITLASAAHTAVALTAGDYPMDRAAGPASA